MVSAPKKIVVAGACTLGGIAGISQFVFPDAEVIPVPLHIYLATGGQKILEDALQGADLFLYLNIDIISSQIEKNSNRETCLAFPELMFDAFHPDLVYAKVGGVQPLISAIQDCNSAIGLWAYIRGCSVEEALTLFTPSVFSRLGYFEYWDASVTNLNALFDNCNIDFRSFFLNIKRRLPFMYTHNHPRAFVLVELFRSLIQKSGYNADVKLASVGDYVPDGLSGVVWPVYPGLGEIMGINSSLLWRRGADILDLRQFLQESFKSYDNFDKADIYCERLSDPIYNTVLEAALAKSV